MAEERLQKILARAGFGSRRSAEELITSGRVVVNGHPAALGSKADSQRDAISVDGRRLKLAEDFVYYAVYKPPQVLSTTAGPDPRPKVTDLVPGGQQLHLVGRLDLDSEGLMLLTNDGDLTQRLTHPRFEAEKEYRVLVAKHPDPEQLATWRRGVVLLDGTHTAPADVRIERAQGKGIWLRVIMHEGHKREIRETARTLGLPVAKLIRVRIASLHVGGLKAGQWRKLAADEVAALRGEAKTPSKFLPSKRSMGRAKPSAKRHWTRTAPKPQSAGAEGKPRGKAAGRRQWAKAEPKFQRAKPSAKPGPAKAHGKQGSKAPAKRSWAKPDGKFRKPGTKRRPQRPNPSDR